MGSTYVDIFATKGIEYIYIITFLALLVGFWRYLMGGAKAAVEQPTVTRRVPVSSWFALPEAILNQGAFLHQGHAWAAPEGSDGVRVGVDDFVGKLLGPPDAVELPEVGTLLSQGAPAWKLRVGSQRFDMVSPVEGEVVAVNREVLERPGLIGSDPYKAGWLMRVRAPCLDANLRNLLGGELARDWMAGLERSMRAHMAGEVGAVLQDGGPVAPGFVRQLFPGNWEQVTRELLMTGASRRDAVVTIWEPGAQDEAEDQNV